MKIAYVGGGYVGLSGAAHFARAGHEAWVVDIARHVVEAIQDGRSPVANLEQHLGFSLAPLVKNGLLRATSNWREVPRRLDAVLIAVPTERGGDPFFAPLWAAFSEVTHNTAPTVPIIVESTVAPGTMDHLHAMAPDRKLAVAPRRDWFDAAGLGVNALTRVLGGLDGKAAQQAADVLEAICPNIVLGSYRAVELVKPLENALLFLPLAYAMETASRYPDVDMNEVMELAGTHFARPTYFLNAGIAGYCINVAAKYLGADGLGAAATATEQKVRAHIWAEIERAVAPTAVLFLGLSYKPNYKVAHRSPTIDFARWAAPRPVFIHDPLFTTKEIIATVPTCKPNHPEHAFPHVDLVMLMTEHSDYLKIKLTDMKPGTTVIDATGLWEDRPTCDGIRYRRLWSAGWGAS